MNLILLIGFISSIFGIIGFLFHYVGLWKYLYYLIIIKIFNRKPMNIQIIIINKYNDPPLKKFNNKIFKSLKENFIQSSEEVYRLALLPESMKFRIKKRIDNFFSEYTIRLDEEPENITIDELQDSSIIHHNLILKLAHPLRITWSELNHLKDIASFFQRIELFLKNELFKGNKIFQHYYICDIDRAFSLKKFKKDYTSLDAKISINMEKIEIIGDNIQYLKDLLEKYYLRLL
ncbi:hypothetical protein LCGC14_1183710 [marine sediment metagenome]|uniref:Uncharacterized protein n=1 Tax=marine sediment metagenome TaxID=412755 RepID=A0A0F9LR62_9ZZZZ